MVLIKTPISTNELIASINTNNQTLEINKAELDDLLLVANTFLDFLKIFKTMQQN